MSRTFVFAMGILLVSCQGATNQSLDDVEQGSALTKCDGSNKSPSDLPIVNAYLNSPTEQSELDASGLQGDCAHLDGK